MSIGIIVPKGFWPRPGETFECELTRVERVGRGFQDIPSGQRATMTLKRYRTDNTGMLTWITERGWFYAKGAMSRYGWDKRLRSTYAVDLPYWVLISAFDRWNPDFAAMAVGLPAGLFPDLPYSERYPRWCAIYLEIRNSGNIATPPANIQVEATSHN